MTAAAFLLLKAKQRKLPPKTRPQKAKGEKKEEKEEKATTSDEIMPDYFEAEMPAMNFVLEMKQRFQPSGLKME